MASAEALAVEVGLGLALAHGFTLGNSTPAASGAPSAVAAPAPSSVATVQGFTVEVEAEPNSAAATTAAVRGVLAFASARRSRLVVCGHRNATPAEVQVCTSPSARAQTPARTTRLRSLALT